jgi:hypothetical protein
MLERLEFYSEEGTGEGRNGRKEGRMLVLDPAGVPSSPVRNIHN